VRQLLSRQLTAVRFKGPVAYFFAAAICVVAVGLWFTTEKRAPEEVPRTFVGNSDPLTATPPAAPVAAPLRAGANPPEMVASAVARPAAVARRFLWEQLAGSGNAMTFAMNAKQRPEAGGYYYATTVARECLLYSKQRAQILGDAGSVPYDQTTDQRVWQLRQRALEEADRYCQGFTFEMYADYLSPTVSNEGKRLNDPLLLARAGLANADVAQRKAAIEQAMSFGDPYLLYSNPEVFFAGDKDGKTYFDGTWQSERGSQLLTAAQLAACDLGMACSSNLMLLKWKCAFESDCHGSLQEQMAHTWSAEEVAFINAARARIGDAYRARDPGVFLPATSAGVKSPKLPP